MEKYMDYYKTECIENYETGRLAKDEIEIALDAVWNWLLQCQGETFFTAKGLEFSYSIRGNEIFVSRKQKSITRASVKLAVEKVLEYQNTGAEIKGPKMLKCFGASYLYPVFLKIGFIKVKE